MHPRIVLNQHTLHAISNSCMNGIMVCVYACIYAPGIQRVRNYMHNYCMWFCCVC